MYVYIYIYIYIYICVCVCMCVCVTIFRQRKQLVTFSAQIGPKMDLWFKIQKTNVGIRISTLEIRCVAIFSQNGQL